VSDKDQDPFYFDFTIIDNLVNGALFFARHPDSFIMTRQLSSTYRDLVPSGQLHLDTTTHVHLPGLAKNAAPRHGRQLIKPPGR
jgi:hypothetical protein